MPSCYYEKIHIQSETPSIEDGMDFQTESRHRKEGAMFVVRVGNTIGLPYYTIATGVV